ncbi:molybdenum cofactor guanylyltransferase [uncultured bacterium]|nr:molybdenum cofactor guanylyltransferase [uncultured bacterium]
MEGEKALRLVRGQTLMQRALETLMPLCGQRAVSTGNRKLTLPRGILALPDLEPHVMQGPLSGLYAGLVAARAAGFTTMLVLACDLPNMPTDLLSLLLRELRGHDVAFCEHGGQPEPLVCALRVAPMLKAVRASLARGSFKVVPLWKAAKCRLLLDADLKEFEPLERTFANVNTLSDLAKQQP